MWRVPYRKLPSAPAAARPSAVSALGRRQGRLSQRAFRRYNATQAAAAAPTHHQQQDGEPTTIKPVKLEFVYPESGPAASKPFQYHPSQFLNLALRIFRHPDEEISSSDLGSAKFLARTQDTRLPIVTAQMILHVSDTSHQDIREALPRCVDWERRLDKLESLGFQREVIFDWVQILTPECPDKRIERFIAHPEQKPAFLLNYILNDRVSAANDDSQLMSSQSLHGLLNHCKSWFAPDTISKSPDASTSNPLPWDASTFNTVSTRLFSLARRIQPRLLVDVADVVAAYIESIFTTCKDPIERYEAQCSIFNHAVQQLATSSPRNPYANAKYNWAAIMRLLSLSLNLKKPLSMESQSYTAIRQVLLTTPKDTAERETATTLKNTWPPYRVAQNGMEESTPVEEFHSRIMKAGAMMQEAGFSKTEFDLALDTLGGVAPDGSPTIQTRASFPQRHADENSLWKAQIRATRNPEEAWQAFQHPPDSSLKADMGVYQEMIYKLLAKSAKLHHDNRAGDGRETTPLDVSNFTEYEKSRVRPPSITQLVKSMIDSGVPLQGSLLNVLIRHAPDLEEALRWSRQSSLSEEQHVALEHILGQHDLAPVSELIKQLPKKLVLATIDLLCRLQPNYTSKTPSHINPLKFDRIRAAEYLATTIRAKHYSPAWESILRALARPKIMLGNGVPEENTQSVLRMSGRILKLAENDRAVTLSMFDSFAMTLRRDLEARLPRLIRAMSRNSSSEAAAADKSSSSSSSSLLDVLKLYNPQTQTPLPSGTLTSTTTTTRDLSPREWNALSRHSSALPTILAARSKLHSLWRELSLSVPAGSGGGKSQPQSQQSSPVVHATPAMVNSYMRALAFLGDFAEMARLTTWVARHSTRILANGHKAKEPIYLARAMCAFRAFAEPMIPGDQMVALRREFEELAYAESRPGVRGVAAAAGAGPGVYWPSDQEVSMYTSGDEWGDVRNLQMLLKLVRQRDQGGDDGGRGMEEEVEEKVLAGEGCGAARNGWTTAAGSVADMFKCTSRGSWRRRGENEAAGDEVWKQHHHGGSSGSSGSPAMY